jgi:hypothetical protein
VGRFVLSAHKSSGSAAFTIEYIARAPDMLRMVYREFFFDRAVFNEMSK